MDSDCFVYWNEMRRAAIGSKRMGLFGLDVVAGGGWEKA
jgi:hypothetical protein